VESFVRRHQGDALEADDAIYLAALLSLATGIVHAMVTVEYWNEWWGYGAFFIAAALGQVMYGLLLFIHPWRYDATGGVNGGGYRAARRVFLAGAWANASIVALYIVTRTIGIPVFGPEAGQVEPVTALSLIVQIAELLLIAYLVRAIRRGDRIACTSQQDGTSAASPHGEIGLVSPAIEKSQP
jgi:hypothetical protein